MNNLAISLLKKHEGYRQYPYKDTVGKLTIGYGLNLDDVGMDEVVASFALQWIVGQRESDLNRLQPIYRTLDYRRQAIILDMAYQLGIAGCLKFKTMWKCLGERDWEGAARAMLDSRWARQTPKRVKELASLMCPECALSMVQ